MSFPSSLAHPLRRADRLVRDAATTVARVSAPAAGRVRPVLRTATPLGWGVLVTVALAWVLGARLGWLELVLGGTACLFVVMLSMPFVLGSARLATQIDVDPLRVFVGTPAAGRLIVTNSSRRRLLPLQVDLPVGAAIARFDIPSLGGTQVHDELFVVPTNRRAVLPLGPATSVHGDPLGLFRREVVTSVALELFVHPLVTPLPALGSGLLRDLEGQTTRDLSVSDLAFHTLRDYVPGDDRRFVHWRSSAKAGKMLVRQFLDTRRSRVTIAVDADLSGYRDEDEFELAISVAASLGVRCLRDELDLTVVAGGQATSPSTPRQLLDALSRSQGGGAERGLSVATARAARLAEDTSLAVLVTGSSLPYRDVLAAAHWYGPGVSPLMIRVETDAPAGLTRAGGVTVLAVRSLADLPLLFGAVAA